MSEIGVGVIGLGFMGKGHVSAYASAKAAGIPCRLAAVADANIDAALATSAGNLSTGGAGPVLGEARRCTSASELLADPSVELVSICTPTDTHKDLAVAALRAGKDVLIEKPVAVTSAEVRAVIAAADAARKVCMPAMVMRFWPGWPWLHDEIEKARNGTGEFGRLIGVTFQRLGCGPTWNAEFYKDPARTGGALVDLHIHDADFLLWCFGRPRAVSSVGSTNQITTVYRFADGPEHVSAQGGWGVKPAFPFRMHYVAMFENATAVFDLSGGAEPVTVYQEGRADKVPVPQISGYEAEVRHMLEAVNAARAGKRFELRATLADALAAAELLEAERRSLAEGREVNLTA